MKDIQLLERNTFESFKKVKSDVLQLNSESNKSSKAIARLTTENMKLHETVAILSQKVADLTNALRHTMEVQQELIKTKTKTSTIIKEVPVIKEIIKEKRVPVIKTITKTVPAKRQSITYVASQTGKKFHRTNCVFAKNIKPKSKITFKTKEAMLNKGYKPCDCVKRY